MRNHRTRISPTHTLTLVGTIYFLEKHAHHSSLFGSRCGILPTGLLRQIWSLFNDPLGHQPTNCLRSPFVPLLEFRILPLHQIYLWNWDRRVLTSISIIHNLNLSFVHAGATAGQIESLLVGWVPVHMLCQLDSAPK
jgi:hypothetical protein